MVGGIEGATRDIYFHPQSVRRAIAGGESGMQNYVFTYSPPPNGGMGDHTVGVRERES